MAYGEEWVTTKLKCPKCKSNNLRVDEQWAGHYISWDINGGKFDRQDGTLEPGGPERITVECKDCSHLWKVRKASQIHDIIDYD